MSTLDGSPGPRKILFLTNIEHGQANVFLATCHALVQLEPGVEIHFATFAGFDESVTAAWQHARRTVPEANPFIYHAMQGKSMTEGLQKLFSTGQVSISCRSDGIPESFLAPLAFSTTTRAIRDAMLIFAPYSGPDLLEVVSSIMAIIKDVAADLVVVDVLMTAALTACYHLGVRFICLSPNTIKDVAASAQPLRARLRYPALFSGFSYPVPWYMIPLNFFFLFYTVIAVLSDSHRRHVKAYLESHSGVVLRSTLDLRGRRILVGSLPELDFAAVVPPHISPCGPIVRSASPVSDTDPGLGRWLARGPTLYINLGSLCRTAEDQASELALALRTILDTATRQPGLPGLQVLWKLKKHGEYQVSEPGCRIHDILGNELQDDRMRIVDWVLPEPISILRTGHVVCSIHHGGANSFNEAVIAGVPQVILPQWTDTYDYSQRVEMLGIGRLGSKTAKPRWIAPELAQEVLGVFAGPESAGVRQRAADLASLCESRGSGAVNAARIILADSRGDGKAAADTARGGMHE